MDAEELRRRREALGMSQSELARALGVPINTVWRWEQTAEKTRIGIRHGRILELALDMLALDKMERDGVLTPRYLERETWQRYGLAPRALELERDGQGEGNDGG
jgi:transcriptional regulator with XRE-family HTH domain